MPENKYQKFKSFIETHPQWFGVGGVFGGINENHIIAELFSKYIYDITPTGGQLPQSEDILNVTNFVKYLEDNKEQSPIIEAKIEQIKQMRDPRRAEITDEDLIKFANLFFEFYDELGFEQDKNLIKTKYENLLNSVISYQAPTSATATKQEQPENNIPTSTQTAIPGKKPQNQQQKAFSQEEKNQQIEVEQEIQTQQETSSKPKEQTQNTSDQPSDERQQAPKSTPQQQQQPPLEQKEAQPEPETELKETPPQANIQKTTKKSTETGEEVQKSQTQQQTETQVGIPQAATQASPQLTARPTSAQLKTNLPQKQSRTISTVQQLEAQGINARKRVPKGKAQLQQQQNKQQMDAQTQQQLMTRRGIPMIPFVNRKKPKNMGRSMAKKMIKGGAALAAIGTGAAIAPDSASALTLIIKILF